MMLQARFLWSPLRAPALGLIAVALVAGAPLAWAQSQPEVTVYHSPDPEGDDPRPEFPPGCAGGNMIQNGGFEFENLTHWERHERDVSTGYFTEAYGGIPPFNTPGWSWPTVGAKTGSYYGVSDAPGDGTHTLSQRFYVPPGAQQVIVSFDMFVNNWADEIVVDPAGLDHNVDGSNQFATVDIVSAAGFDANHFTLAPADVVRNLYVGTDPPLDGEGDPNPYTSYVFDISDDVSAGGEFVLRFAETNNIDVINMGIDDVSVTSPHANCVIQGTYNEQVEVWIDGGPNQGGGEEDLCNLGVNGSSGDQLCGVDLTLVMEGPGEFIRFVPDSALDTLVYRPLCSYIEEGPCSLPGGTKLIRLNFTRGATEPSPGPRKIGDLYLDTRALTPSIETAVKAFGLSAGARLQIRPIGEAANSILVASSQATPVPEPVQLLQLLCGVVGLRLLERRRR